MTNNTAATLIDKYAIYLTSKDGQEMVGVPGRLAAAVKRDGAGPRIKAHKAEIITILKARAAEAKAAAEARQAKIDAIPGLAEIRAAVNDAADWDDELRRTIESGRSAMSRPRPDHDIAALKARYPHAAAYIRAENLLCKSNPELSAIGRKAEEMVISGDWQAALDYMDAEQKAFTERHTWD